MSKTKKVSKKYIIVLKNINIDKIHTKYGLIQSNIVVKETKNPENTTKITELIENNNSSIFSFLDESKRKKKCSISMIDYNNGKEVIKKSDYNCFWDHSSIPENIKPIGCPINYISDKIVKTYFSEISQANYTINQHITSKNKEMIKTINDKRIEIKDCGFYETDGVFCSFNCCISYINANYHNPIYNNSKYLLYKMYNQMYKKNVKIEPAPNFRKLKSYGGDLTIEEFRNSFNRVIYKNYGVIKPVQFISIGFSFEEQYKF
jgi:hypothetical protein